MTVFTEFPLEVYSKSAFDKFDASKGDLNIDNARAMMWTAQLAYEAGAYIKGQHDTVDTVSQWWGFAPVMPFVGDKVGEGAIFDTLGLIGERNDAVILAFGGTDPGVWMNWATDADFRLDPRTNAHAGIQTALNGVAGENGAPDYVGQAVTLSKQTDKPLWITGHSLGGALAVLAAQHVAKDVAPKAVYTFGMPRPGGVQFQAAYNDNEQLGPATYRFVHGLDVVPHIAPAVVRVGALDVEYRHVGSVLQCDSGKKFDPAVSGLSDLPSNEPLEPADIPALGRAILNELERLLAIGLSPATGLGQLQRLFPGLALLQPGPGPLGQLYRVLPQQIRDHLQDSYWNALAP